ncbi:hypothetical protein EZH22_21570 [Xanthobacter dioxanivorans]|uniref:Uncharacterized protein n=1 Tax=Xanthobacter dioxanivorans TaxID=2528964 RepID=A0A974SGU2_9HYPH|nr:hypothetical protein [Xanthobacter dioxanivorans]QRG05621.1 hypothetical protein EZH22_21570 [Xanthobacter dioxanivorans]
MGVPYVLETADPVTGEAISFDLGVSMTLSEFTDSMGVPLRLGRAVLVEMGLLQSEGGRLRIKLEHQAAGLGMRLHKKGTRFPFDVLFPAGQAWAKERWSSAKAEVERHRGSAAALALQAYCDWRGGPMTTQMDVCWLLDHFPELTTRDIARVLSVSEAAVFKWSSLRTRQRDHAESRKRLHRKS